jgi:hypothetical protein
MKGMSMSITDYTKVARSPAQIVERIRKLRLSKMDESGQNGILRQHMHHKSKVVYMDPHKRETLLVSPKSGRLVVMARGGHHRSLAVK